MHHPKYALFYDFHTSPEYPDVGVNFNAEEFTDRLLRCGVDYLTFHARCNMGTAYYDTKIGIRHPGLKFDLFGELAAACRKKGIALTAYLNGGISHQEWLEHREWGSIAFNGQSYRGERCSPMVRTMCYNTPYRDHLIAMICEIAENYPVAGFFLDCMSAFPCVCPCCVREMKERGIDWRNEDAVEDFAAFSAARLAEDIAAAARKYNPEYLLYFNCVPYEAQAESGSYLECECIPSRSCWGYEYLPVMSHYMRTLGKPCLNMTGRFFAWGDFGGLRPAAAVKSELLYGLANGLRPNIGDHFLPHGEICIPVMEQTERIYRELQKMEPWFDAAVPQAEIAVVYPKPIASIRYDAEVRGVVRMLSELHAQFDIVTTAASWEKYELLIFPDSVRFDREIAERVRKHLDAGKKIIASGWSGLDSEGRFVFPEAWGVRCDGNCPFTPAFFLPAKRMAEGLPGMPWSIYADGISLRPAAETEVGAVLVKPQFNHEWNGLHAEFYHAPETVSDLPFLTFSRQVAHFSHALFSGYKNKASVSLRQIFRNVLEHWLPEPMLRVENAPSFLRAFVTRQAECTVIHLLAYLPEQRGVESEMIEDELIVENIALALRLDGKSPLRVSRVPECEPLEFTAENAYLKIKLPRFQGHALIAVEFQ